MNKILDKKSRTLVKILRHNPGELIMDEFGWILVKDILKHLSLTISELTDIVESNDKQRFSFDTYKLKIRADQGHSDGIAKSLNFDILDVSVNDIFLYHGTNTYVCDLIMKSEIIKGLRNHVHWTTNKDLAIKRAKQKSKDDTEPVLIILDHVKYIKASKENVILISKNNVYLTNNINKDFLKKEFIY
jgi:putative RNA 2'-phosphotransferase